MNVLVTGANRGLGLMLSSLYAAQGHRTFAGVLAREDHAEILRQAENHPHLTVLPLDVSNRRQALEAADRIRQEGGLDALVNVAGLLCSSDRQLPITDADVDDFQRAFEVNVLGAANIIHAFHDLIRPQGWLIDITSEGGSLQNIGTVYPAYSVTKAAENKLVAIFWKMNPGYHVYAMHPGRMNTEMGRDYAQIEPAESAQWILDLTTGRKKVSPQAEWFIDYRGEPMEV